MGDNNFKIGDYVYLVYAESVIKLISDGLVRKANSMDSDIIRYATLKEIKNSPLPTVSDKTN